MAIPSTIPAAPPPGPVERVSPTGSFSAPAAAASVGTEQSVDRGDRIDVKPSTATPDKALAQAVGLRDSFAESMHAIDIAAGKLTEKRVMELLKDD